MTSRQALALLALAAAAVYAWRTVNAGRIIGTAVQAGRDTITAAAVTVWEYQNPRAVEVENWLTQDSVIVGGRVVSPVPEAVREAQRKISAQPGGMAPAFGYDYLDPTAPIQ